MKDLLPVKATVLDDDAFRLLAYPYDGPIASPHNARGVDLDGQWFSHRTNIEPDWFKVRVVDWHHGHDKLLGRTVLGKAGDLEEEEDGWWVTVWLKHGERRVDLIKRLAEKGGQLFGSSETVPGMGKMRSAKGELINWRRDIPGEIVRWPYIRQTLSTSPQNTLSVLRPLKALIEESEPTQSFFDDLARYVDNLVQPVSDLSTGGETAKGRLLRARGDALLREAIAVLTEHGWHPVKRGVALQRLSEVLDELERYIT